MGPKGEKKLTELKWSSASSGFGNVKVNAVNAAFDARLDMEFFEELGRETIRMEKTFNTAAGFNEEDDELPEFFYSEPLAPSGKTARHRSADVNRVIREALG